MKTLLKVLVGSHAHGLATPESDRDYRGVFIVPTSDLLRLGSSTKTVQWIEGNEDDTSYELGHFLYLATKSNPSILEVFKAPVVETTSEGEALRNLFPYVWSSKGVFAAFDGYSLNQRKKFLSDEEQFSVRRWKYAVAYIRVLLQGISLLSTGDFSLEVGSDQSALRSIKNGEWKKGTIIDFAESLREQLKLSFSRNPDKTADLEVVNDFLLQLRKASW